MEDIKANNKIAIECYGQTTLLTFASINYFLVLFDLLKTSLRKVTFLIPFTEKETGSKCDISIMAG